MFYSTDTLNLLTNSINSIVKILLLRLTADRYFGVDDKLSEGAFHPYRSRRAGQTTCIIREVWLVYLDEAFRPVLNIFHKSFAIDFFTIKFQYAKPVT
jgi:hypothetical protein